jgi:hypothetical protein
MKKCMCIIFCSAGTWLVWYKPGMAHRSLDVGAFHILVSPLKKVMAALPMERPPFIAGTMPVMVATPLPPHIYCSIFMF